MNPPIAQTAILKSSFGTNPLLLILENKQANQVNVVLDILIVIYFSFASSLRFTSKLILKTKPSNFDSFSI